MSHVHARQEGLGCSYLPFIERSVPKIIENQPKNWCRRPYPHNRSKCSDAHSFAEAEPRAHRLLKNNRDHAPPQEFNVKIEDTCCDQIVSTPRVFDIPLTNLHNTKFTRWIIETKCRNWQNCQYAHVQWDELCKFTRHYYCNSHECRDPKDTTKPNPKCPYAHSEREFIPPEKFFVPVTGFDKDIPVFIPAGNAIIEVPLKYIAATNISTHVQLEYCENKCCDNETCEQVHFIPDVWNDIKWATKLKEVKVKPRILFNRIKPSSGPASVEPVVAKLFTFPDDASRFHASTRECDLVDVKYDEKHILSRRWKASIKAWLDSRQCLPANGHNVFTYHPSLIIGKGRTATVYIGWSPRHRAVAVKIYKPEDEVFVNYEKETTTFVDNTANSGIVGYYDGWGSEPDDDDKIRVAVVMELMEGSLEELLTMQTPYGTPWYKSGPVAQLEATQYVLGSVLATLDRMTNERLESEQVWIHRDIKPENIMVNVKKEITLVDFGLAKTWDNRNDQIATTHNFTLSYAAPELLAPIAPMAEATTDLFSLGLVFRRMMVPGEWTNVGDLTFLKNIEPPSEWPQYRQYAAEHLLSAMLETLPGKRAFCQQAKRANFSPHRLVLSHPFFWSAEKSQLFLHELGNYVKSSAIVQTIANTVETSITRTSVRDVEKNNWFFELPREFRAHLPYHGTHSEGYDTMEKQINPLLLLRFIRNQVNHKGDSSYPVLLRQQLEAHPLFLQVYPHLVCDCWTWLIDNDHVELLPSPIVSYMTTSFVPTLPKQDTHPAWGV